MSKQKGFFPNIQPKTPFVLGCAGFVLVLFLNGFYFKESILGLGWPNWSPGYLLRSLIILCSISALGWSVIRRSGLSVGADNEMVGNGLGRFEGWSITITLVVSLLIIIILLISPIDFTYLTIEDQPVEWASFILLFTTSIIFIMSLIRSWGKAHIPRLVKWTLALFAGVFFIISMEEVSWFQRISQIELPDQFQSTLQQEINFHNFATTQFELLYYFWAFVFLVVFPFLRSFRLFPTDNKYLALFIPRSFMVLIGAVATAYNFDLWNNIITQVSFFGAIFILISFVRYNSNRNFNTFGIITILLMVIT